MADNFATGATSAVWSLRAYVLRNRYRSMESMTAQDFDAMFDLFVAENAEISSTPDYSDTGAGTLSFPGGIDAADSQASADQATYPESFNSG